MQLRHGRWATLITLAALTAAITLNLLNGVPERAALFGVVSLTVLWVTIRIWQGQMGRLESGVAVLGATLYYMVPTWTNPVFTEAWQALAGLSGVLTVTATFGFTTLFPAVTALLAAALIRLVVTQYLDPGLFHLLTSHEDMPVTSLWFYLLVDGFFLLLMGKQVATTQKLIIQARDEALLAQSAESRFLSNMSHEIRNPLQGIQGLLEAIQSKATSDEVAEDAGLALEVTERLKSLLNDVLDYQKLLEGKLTINHRCFDSNALRKSLKGTISALLQNSKKDLDYQFHEAANLPAWVYGDDTRIFQVIINLMSNAFKFTEAGSVVVKAHYDVELEHMSISVADTGPGMSEDTLNRLFERFRQGSEGLSKAHEGTGLGLAIAHELVTLMGGSLSVESELNVGSTFVLDFPLPPCAAPFKASGPSTNSSAPTTGQLAEGGTDLTGLTLLCVDDDLLNLRVLKAPLAQANATVLTASSGQEALRLLDEHPVHMVLTDISMPEMDGTELQQEIARRYSQLPVIAVTGNALPDDVAHYRQLGFMDVLGKPFRREELLAFVKKNIAAALRLPV